MANYIVSYDLNGPTPSHKQVDDLFASLGATRGRVLETVWYVGWDGSADALHQKVDALLSDNDRLLVVQADYMVWRNLLITDDSLQESHRLNR